MRIICVVSFICSACLASLGSASEVERLTERKQILEAIELAVAKARETIQSQNRDGLSEIYGDRNRLISQTLSKAEADGFENVAPEDLAAFAMGYEYLNQPQRVIELSRRAVDADPRCENAYFPLIRCLVNADRTSEAARYYEIGRRSLPDSRPMRLCDLIFLHVQKGKRNWNIATYHGLRLTKFYIDTVATDPHFGRQGTQLVPLLSTCIKESKMAERHDNIMESLVQRLVDQINDGAGQDNFWVAISNQEFCSRIRAVCSNAQQKEDALNRWAVLLEEYSSRMPEESIASQVDRLVQTHQMRQGDSEPIVGSWHATLAKMASSNKFSSRLRKFIAKRISID